MDPALDAKRRGVDEASQWVRRKNAPLSSCSMVLLSVDSQGPRVTSDVGLIQVREPVEHLGLNGLERLVNQFGGQFGDFKLYLDGCLHECALHWTRDIGSRIPLATDPQASCARGSRPSKGLSPQQMN